MREKLVKELIEDIMSNMKDIISVELSHKGVQCALTIKKGLHYKYNYSSRNDTRLVTAKIFANKCNIKRMKVTSPFEVLDIVAKCTKSATCYGVIAKAINADRIYNVTHPIMARKFIADFVESDVPVNDSFDLYVYETDVDLGIYDKHEVLYNVFKDAIVRLDTNQLEVTAKLGYIAIYDEESDDIVIVYKPVNDEGINQQIIIPVHIAQIRGILYPYYGLVVVEKDMIFNDVLYGIFRCPNTDKQKQHILNVCWGNAQSRGVGNIGIFAVANFDSAYTDRFAPIYTKQMHYITRALIRARLKDLVGGDV